MCSAQNIIISQHAETEAEAKYDIFPQRITEKILLDKELGDGILILNANLRPTVTMSL
mgnify:CR=1 FL=1